MVQTAQRSTKFVLIGCGGLGSPTVLGLVAGGARRFVLIDDDIVDITNLHRQVVFDPGDRGARKADATKRWIEARVASTDIVVHSSRLRSASELAGFADEPDCVVIEGTDSSEFKFDVQDYCVRAQRRAVIGGALAWRGQAFAYVPPGACMRCWFEDPAPEEATCESAGVLSTTTGVVGHSMAALALGVASGQIESSILHVWDGRSGRLSAHAAARRPDCRCASGCAVRG